MKAKELLNPRYKVIANYPNSLINVGDIINVVPGTYNVLLIDEKFNEDRIVIYADDYPHLFKKLE